MMMDELAERFTRADPARTPASAPVTPDAEALLRQIISTPRDAARPYRNATPGWRRRKPMLVLAGAGVIALVVALMSVVSIWGPKVPGSSTDETPVPPTADYPWYASEQELVAAADAIVRGRISDRRDAQIDGIDYTVVTVQIDAVAKGPLRPGERLDMKYPVATDPVPLALGLGDDAVLFLALFPPDPASLVNPTQGSYLLVDGSRLQAADENPIRLSGELRAHLGVVD